MKKIDTLLERLTPSPLLRSAEMLCIAAIALPGSPRVLAQCNNTPVLSITGPSTGIWTAPATGGPFAVRISATGGAGGAYLEANPDRVGGTGATMSGTFVVQEGEKLFAIAGGGGNHSQLEGGGAGGGSGAVNCGTGLCADGIILIIAAGGNGGQLDTIGFGFGLGGSASTSGSGNGGNIVDNDSGGGGGGLNGPGQSANSGGQGGGQVSNSSISAGGAGSFNPISGNNKGGDGMGGGGGGGDGATTETAAGGGGGHTGGDAGNISAASSFNSGDDPGGTDGIAGGAISGPPSTPANAGTVSFICLASLPVKLTNFKAIIHKNGSVALRWNTAVEKNNRGYEVERSINNRDWSVLGFVKGNGTTTQSHDYVFTDENPLAGINYYRLKQMDMDGRFEYSPMVVADVHSHKEQFDIFPNPSLTGELSIRIVSKTQEGYALLEIYDWAGYKVWKETLTLAEGTMVWPVSMTTFPKGAYTARLEMPEGFVQFKKILLQ